MASKILASFFHRPWLKIAILAAIALLVMLYSILSYDPIEGAESANSEEIHLQSGYGRYSPEHLRWQQEFTRKWERITSTELVPHQLPVYLSETIEPMTYAGCLNAVLAFTEATGTTPETVNETPTSKEFIFRRTHEVFTIACAREKGRERMILSRELPQSQWPIEMR